MAVQGVNGLAVAAAGGGLLLLWSGAKGASVSQSLRSLLSGHQPTGVATNPISGGTGTVTTAAGTDTVNPSAGQWTTTGLEKLWTSMGGNAARASVAACIAMHESSGNASATSSNPDGGTNVGLWQLDTKGKGAGYSVAQLQNPETNARVAIMGSANGSDWSAWSTAPMCGV